jgi:hypothetical protein
MTHLLQEGLAHLRVFYLGRILKQREMRRNIHTLNALQTVKSKCVAKGQHSYFLLGKSQVQFSTRSQAMVKQVPWFSSMNAERIQNIMYFKKCQDQSFLHSFEFTLP